MGGRDPDTQPSEATWTVQVVDFLLAQIHSHSFLKILSSLSLSLARFLLVLLQHIQAKTRTMKLKVIIKISNSISKKSAFKLMKIATRCNGVETVALRGDGRDMIEITGEGMDAFRIVRMMCKTGRRADLLSIGPATSGIDQVQVSSTNGINEGSVVVMQLPEPIPYPETPSYPVYETLDYDPRCNVMLIAVCIFPLISLLISLAKEMLTF